MNKQILVNQTLNENLQLLNGSTPVDGATFSDTTATVSPEGVLFLSVRPDGVDIFGTAPGTATIHIETIAHFSIGGANYVKAKFADIIFDCVPPENTTLTLTP